MTIVRGNFLAFLETLLAWLILVEGGPDKDNVHKCGLPDHQQPEARDNVSPYFLQYHSPIKHRINCSF